MKTLLISVLFFALTYASSALAQQEPEADTDAFEQEISDGVDMMNHGEFARADTHFKNVLGRVKVVPADLCFYFGKNSYHLKKYRQSMDWLNKYMELKGTKGEFFDQAVEYLELAEEGYLAASSNNATAVQSAKKQVAESSLDCTLHPFVSCPVCRGTGVIIEQGSLGASIYKSCPYSDEHGRMTCEDYQLYVKGQLFSKNKE